MRPSQITSVTLVLVLALNSFATFAVEPDDAGSETAGANIALPELQGRGQCNTDIQGMQGSMEQYRQQLRQRILAHPMARQATDGEALANSFTECTQKMQNLISACNPQQLGSVECKKADVLRGGHVASRPNSGSFRDDPLFMASTMAAEANCIRSVGACLRYGSRRANAETNQTVQKACIDNLRARMQQFNNAGDANQVLERAFIQAAEKYHQQVTTRLLQPVAECRDREGQTAEQQAQQFLTTARAASADGSGNARIECIDRQASSRFCLYSSDGSRIQEIGQDDEGRHIRETGRSVGLTAQGCSTGVLGTSPTGQQHISTAGHCLREGQDSTRVMVYDRNGQAVERVASGCQRQFTTTAGNERDFAICRIDQPVDVAPMSVATLNPNRTGSDCVQLPRDYVRECGPGFFQRLSDNGTEVRATFFPANGQMTAVRGRLLYDSDNNLLYTDAVFPRGSSGTPYFVEVPDGRGGTVRLQVASQSWSSERSNSSFGTVIRTEEFRRMRGDPSTDQLRLATALFDDFRHTL